MHSAVIDREERYEIRQEVDGLRGLLRGESKPGSSLTTILMIGLLERELIERLRDFDDRSYERSRRGSRGRSANGIGCSCM